MAQLEKNMQAYEAVLRERGYTPTVWPVEGKLEGGFGGRRNPFGGGSYEFHSGQDIEAAMGAHGSFRSKRHGHFCRLAKWLWSTRGYRSRRRLNHSLRTPVPY